MLQAGALFCGQHRAEEDMKTYVDPEHLVTEEELEGRDPGQLVEVIVSGAGRCCRHRLEDVVPDLARALSNINASIVHMSGIITEQVGAEAESFKCSWPRSGEPCQQHDCPHRRPSNTCGWRVGGGE